MIALLTEEDEARELLARLQRSGTRLTPPLAVWEATVGGALRRHGSGDAFDRFGKGRHPASFNSRGCFAYACAPSIRRETFRNQISKPPKGPGRGGRGIRKGSGLSGVGPGVGTEGGLVVDLKLRPR